MKYIQILIALLLISYSAISADRPEHYKCGTFLSEDEKAEILRYYKLDPNTGRPKYQATYNCPNGFFAIHYDTTGIHAISMTDENSNGLPDYIDSTAYYFNFAYDKYVNDMGYLAPPRDNYRDGSDRFDVYIKNIGDGDAFDAPVREDGGYYGITFTDDEIKPARRYPRYTSYIIIDNDYSINDSVRSSLTHETTRAYYETGIMALKITAAHELFHSIQFVYGKAEPYIRTLAEMSCVWMEYRLHPDSEDYWQYTNKLMNNPQRYPFGITDAYTGYNFSVFGHYIYKKYGDTLMKRIWELIYDEINPYAALDSAFKEQGSGMNEAWCDFYTWLYRTGSRAEEGYLDAAANFNEIAFNPQIKFQMPSEIVSGYMKTYEVRAIRFIFPPTGQRSEDTLDIMLTNLDFEAAKHSSPRNTAFTIAISTVYEDGAQKLGDTDYFYQLNASSFIVDSLFFNAGAVTEGVSTVFPNPYSLSEDDGLMFPIPDGIELNMTAQLTIYSKEMVEIHTGKHEISSLSNLRGIYLERPRFLSPGVYIYSVIDGDKRKIGKFAVIK